MLVQLLTIGGQRIWRQLPLNINNTQEFRGWVCKEIMEPSLDCPGDIETHTQKILKKELAIRVNGRSISDRIIQEWKNRLDTESGSEPMLNVEWHTRGKGGFIMDVINAIVAIFRFMLFIPKFIIWLGRLIIWMIKLLIYLVNVVFVVMSKDGILGLIKFIVNEIVLVPFKLMAYFAKQIINILGKQTVYGIWGADNARSSNLGKPKAGIPSDSQSGGGDVTDDLECDGQQKCYISPDGSIPFPVVVITVLCPPVGVFMEYGVRGWFKILVCLVLTLFVYFPGLIYALILLYC